MSESVFSSADYKCYLKARLSLKGEKAAFANHLGCQASFLSQVLCGSPNLSLEQGVLANDYFRHSPPEEKYFLCLLQMERAGSQRLKAYFQKELAGLMSQQRKVVQRIAPSKQISAKARAEYYSSWVYGAIHVLASIPTPDQWLLFADHTGLKREELERIVAFLIECGLLVERAGQLQTTGVRLHLPGNDPMVFSHHRNLRIHALEEMKLPDEQNLHYSLLTAISRKDGLKIRDMILKFIESTDQVIRPSVEESAYQLNLDFFEI